MSKALKVSIAAAWMLAGSTYITLGSQALGVGGSASNSSAGDAADLYAASCANCHGTDGKARTAKGRRVGATDFTKSDWNTNEARGIRIISNGKSDMPAFKEKLTADEIKDVFGYVLKFRQ